MQMSLLETSQNHIGFVTQTRSSFAQFMVQFIQGMAAEVFHLNLFQIMPYAFIRIQVGRIARQAFQMDASSGTLAQKILNCLPTMGGQPIPNDEQVAVNVTQQMFQKADNGCALESDFLDLINSRPSGVIALMTDR
jgi:hypothetical protein